MNPQNQPETIEPDGPHMRRCSRCGRSFSTRNAANQHIQAVHKGKGHRVSARRPDDDEESLADIAIEAAIKRASGEALDLLEASLLTE